MGIQVSNNANCLLQTRQQIQKKTVEAPDAQKKASVCFWADTADDYIQRFCQKLPGESTCNERERKQVGGQDLPCVVIMASDSELAAVTMMDELAGRKGSDGPQGQKGQTGNNGR